MSQASPSPAYPITKIFCSVFGHDYRISKEITYHITEYQCAHCGNEATTNAQGHLELMTPKSKEINAVLAHVHAKKIARKSLLLTSF